MPIPFSGIQTIAIAGIVASAGKVPPDIAGFRRGCAGVVAYRPPRKVARIAALPEASGSGSPLALVRTVERTPPVKAYASPESYLLPGFGKLTGKEVSGSCKELSPQCFGGGGRRSEKVDEEKENGMWHGLSGRFPSVSLFKEYQNAAMALLSDLRERIEGILRSIEFAWKRRFYEHHSELADGLAYVAGHDEESRPVLIFRMKQDYTKLHSQKLLTRLLVFTMEVAISTIPKNVEEFVMLFDTSSTNIRNWLGFTGYPFNIPHCIACHTKQVPRRNVQISTISTDLDGAPFGWDVLMDIIHILSGKICPSLGLMYMRSLIQK
ncbi:uncharacterized protein LOC107639771 isoform X3 [Arachis ipaensis]|uniref:uncharacterized protein LOC107639771 isoform X3 n=1 Tax=Arachis ipaensis TaxID=130454 RepID=UPI000A2B5FD4|nr:uncharacterized protein LOC107639771 isoform X3 [Arachis ipaensis]XP_025649153.1 uncharacterized protein LOC112743927 isoform X3 [Arachis hypogaea]